jgi:hypothetical protein
VTELVRPTHLLDELARNGTLRKTGLFLSEPDISYERLEAVGAFLASVRKTVQFAIGDLLLQVEVRFPEKFSQFAEILEMSEGGLQEYLRVAEKVPRSIRRENLSWSHHRAVASLSKVNKDGNFVSDVNSQKQWLERAETEKLSHHQLRDALRTEEPPDPGVCRCCHRPYDR